MPGENSALKLEVRGEIFPCIQGSEDTLAFVPDVPVAIFAHEEPHWPLATVCHALAADNINKKLHGLDRIATLVTSDSRELLGGGGTEAVVLWDVFVDRHWLLEYVFGAEGSWCDDHDPDTEWRQLGGICFANGCKTEARSGSCKMRDECHMPDTHHGQLPWKLRRNRLVAWQVSSQTDSQ